MVNTMPYVATSFQNRPDCGTRNREIERQGFLLGCRSVQRRISVVRGIFLFDLCIASVDRIV